LGIRHALCCYNVVKGSPCGYADFDFFQIKSARRGNHYDAFAGVDFSQYDDREGLLLVRPHRKRPMQHFEKIGSGDWLVFNNLHFKKRPRTVAIELRAETSGAEIELREDSIDGRLLAVCRVEKSKSSKEWEKQVFTVDKIKKGKTKVYFLFKGDCKNLSVKSFVFE